mmetsp:Transcript_58687/g.132829  ORF Transcript_58687/g.132829 Transcript_58687/m.132829 type:complete len:407 (+) Transcript_58687:26-1246(+)
MEGSMKMFAVVPAMFIAGKIDWTNESMVTNIRLAYFTEQGLLLSWLCFLYLKVTGNPNRTKIFIKKAASMTTPKPKWTHTTYAAFEINNLASVGAQLVLGLILTVVLHFKFNMKQAILMQAVMSPLAFIDSAVVRMQAFGRPYSGILEGDDRPPEDEEVEEDPSVETSSGKARVDAKTGASNAKDASKSAKEAADSSESKASEIEPEDAGAGVPSGPVLLAHLIQETWDSGKNVQYGPLIAALTPENVNTKSESEATALMVVAAGVGDVGSWVNKILSLGADLCVKDEEGWTALHWACFHGNLSGVTALCGAAHSTGQAKHEFEAALATEDDEGLTPLDLAKQELETAIGELTELKDSETEATDKELSKEHIASKEKQVATKRGILTVLEASSGARGADEKLELID